MIIGVPVYDGADMLDVTGPCEMFHWAGFEIDMLAAERGPMRFGSKVFTFTAPKSFAEARTYDAIWVPGGEPDAIAAIIGDPKRRYLDFLRAQAERVRMLCSVCDGAMLLAAAGLLDGYEATTHWAFTSCFQRYPKVKVAPGHPRFVLDRNRLTGGGVASGLDEALKLIELLGGLALAQKVQQDVQYYPDPPVDSAIPPTPAECPIPLRR